MFLKSIAKKQLQGWEKGELLSVRDCTALRWPTKAPEHWKPVQSGSALGWMHRTCRPMPFCEPLKFAAVDVKNFYRISIAISSTIRYNNTDNRVVIGIRQNPIQIHERGADSIWNSYSFFGSS